MRKKPIVALIYDFDGTLSPGNMQEFGFIQAVGKSPEEFWKMSENVAKGQEASQILCYMKLMIDEAQKAGINLKRETFVGFGKSIELFEGVKEWFSLINDYGMKHGVMVEHYINSSGLIEIIEGSPIGGEFKKIFACSFMYDENGNAVWPAVAVDFTNKTQFLFKINKGIMSIRDSLKVNESQPEDTKPVPFSNMIYFGDGTTDIPCMKIVKMFGGNSIAVYPPSERLTKAAEARKMLNENRVNFICPADYRKGSEIYNVVTTIIDKIESDSEYSRLQRINSRRLGKGKQ
ncbi:MAG: haloacid dehalogenase-like hydrolase [Bacteroidales bacterium]|jgi:phosphoserine phosphatase|nr:haloacid dehalogenase-like hydrolase [Bacteroidales bacterium]MCI2121771.1 haloacid dehalogenase-like hydrolase [Bacteroidales bacterium]MCI2144757.1 haloacid dehalogenase-like hydrolase [Bacteroidales bacterium]